MNDLWSATREPSGGSFARHTRTLDRAWRELQRILDVTPDSEGPWLDGDPHLARFQACLPVWQAAAAQGRLTEAVRTREAAVDVQHLRSLGLGAVVDDALASYAAPEVIPA